MNQSRRHRRTAALEGRCAVIRAATTTTDGTLIGTGGAP